MGLVERLAELVSFDTRNPEGDERPLVHRLAGELRALGALTVDEVEVGDHAYVYARFGGERPTLLLNAEESFLPASKAEGLESYFPQARAETIAGAGHWLQHDKPDEVLRAIRTFLGLTGKDH